MKFTKKLLATALVFTMLIGLMPTITLASDITVTIDGQPLTFAGQGPVMTNGRTMVPVRGVFETLGFVVDWDIPTRTATLTRADYTVIISVGSYTFTTNGTSHTLDVPAQLIGGSTMLPIAAVLRSVGYHVDWDNATRTVLITSSVAYVPQPTPPATVPNTAIGRHLGIAYTVLSHEYTSDAWVGTTRWQFLQVHGNLNLNNFPAFTEYALPDFFNSNPGDAFIVTWDRGYQSLIIDLGGGQLHREWLFEDEWSDFLSHFDLDQVRERIEYYGSDLNVPEGHVFFQPDWVMNEFSFDFNDGTITRWQFIHVDGFDTRRFQEFHQVGNIFGSEQWNFFLVLSRDGSKSIHVDVGGAFDLSDPAYRPDWLTPYHRAFYVIALD